ncbi:uncharacterized protein [Dermacentor andersoni]|uniref:uncharacterized protein n=1 Tax=Dermacentor andersoni TaxID=34620 RepID=UPI002155B002|nr:alpha-crystallin A chain-like [Dermacentor andersoni]
MAQMSDSTVNFLIKYMSVTTKVDWLRVSMIVAADVINEERKREREAAQQISERRRQSAVRQADKKTKQTTTDRISSCPSLRGAAHSGSPRKRPRSLGEEGTCSPDDSKFIVNLDVRGYKREEISIKAVGDRVEVSAKHEEGSEDGSNYVKHEFTRRFTLPEGVKAETVTCALSSSGVLAIEAPKPKPPSKKPKTIPTAVQSSV